MKLHHWTTSKLEADMAFTAQNGPCMQIKPNIVAYRTIYADNAKCGFVLFESLRPINNLSVKQVRVFQG